MKNTILIVIEKNMQLADLTHRLVEAQGLIVRLTQELREACELLAQGLDIVLLTSPLAVAAVRTASFVHRMGRRRILVVAAPDDSKEGILEIMEAGAFSFMRSPVAPKTIVKEMHRLRRLLHAA